VGSNQNSLTLQMPGRKIVIMIKETRKGRQQSFAEGGEKKAQILTRRKKGKLSRLALGNRKIGGPKGERSLSHEKQDRMRDHGPEIWNAPSSKGTGNSRVAQIKAGTRKKGEEAGEKIGAGRSTTKK